MYINTKENQAIHKILLFIYKKKVNVSCNDSKIKKHQIQSLLNNYDEETCSICLETIKVIGEEYSGCVTCNAVHHSDFIHDENYPCQDIFYNYYCICKEIMGFSCLAL